MKQFHIAEPGESPHGPYDESMVKRAFEHGMYPEGTLAWHEGASDWMPINHFFDVRQPPRSLTPPPLPETSTSRQTKAPSPDLGEYYIFEPGKLPDGPYSEKELLDGYAQHIFDRNASVWGENTKGWIRLSRYILDKYGYLNKSSTQEAERPTSPPARDKGLRRSTGPQAKQQHEPEFLPNTPPNMATLPIAARWNPLNALTSNFYRYATFSGRTCRAEYWYFTLSCVLIDILCFVIFALLYEYSRLNDNEIHALSVIVDIIFFLPSMAVACRRMHDIGINGSVGCIIAGIVSICNAAMPWDDDPAAFLVVICTLALIVFIVIGCIPGKNDGNPYGKQPLPPV